VSFSTERRLDYVSPSLPKDPSEQELHFIGVLRYCACAWDNSDYGNIRNGRVLKGKFADMRCVTEMS
jgi:hypothetical protein